VQISGYLGKSKKWDNAMVTFAARYAATTTADHAALIDSVARTGRARHASAVP
jgi:hypothetical protein